jgi:two-component system, chemotaxis family, chemotaxis protein CheY
MALNILIVDDSVAMRMILQRALRKTSLPLDQVFEAGDGSIAIEVLKKESINVILADINMPNMDGLQMLAALQTNDHWKQIPVVMISTESSQTKVMEALRLGAKGFIRKPFVPDEVGDKLASFVQ